jgi:hypothetical protein
MTPTSLTLSMSSLLFFIILLSSWFLWGYLFNLANVWPRLHLAYLLGSSPSLNYVAPLMALGFLVSLVALPPLSFYFCKKPLGEDVWHADVLLRLGDVHMAFGIFFQCFV